MTSTRLLSAFYPISQVELMTKSLQRSAKAHATPANAASKQPDRKVEAPSRVAPATVGSPMQRAQTVQRWQQSLGNRHTGEALRREQSRSDAGPGERTGLPDQLKAGVEALSGVSLDRVRVHYASSRPAQVNALAYAQGTDIHLAPGQERHLAHEAWHVVQQAQGRVRPTLQARGVAINDDPVLEREADVMGARAARAGFAADQGRVERLAGTAHSPAQRAPDVSRGPQDGHVVQLRALVSNQLNIVGENHEESGKRRAEERMICEHYAGGRYWTEAEFNFKANRSFFERLFQTGPRRMGDSPLLRMQMQAACVTHWIRVPKIDGERTLADLLVSESAEDKDIVSRIFKEHLASVLQAFEQVKLKSKAIPELHLQQDELLAACLKLKSQLLFTRDENAGGAAVVQTAKLIDDLVDDSRDDLSRLRSAYMHQSGSLATAKRGVWKIGDDHVPEMVDHANGEPPSYNLITKQQFNERYFPESLKTGDKVDDAKS